MARFIKPVLLISIFSTLCFADAKDSTWCIVLFSNDTLTNCTLLEVRDSALAFSRDTIESVSIGSIRGVFRQAEGDFWTGATYGALAGAGVGAVAGAVTYRGYQGKQTDDGGYFSNISSGPSEGIGRGMFIFGGGLLGSLGGVVIGGVIGSLSGIEAVYDLSEKSHTTRVMILRTLVEGEGPE